MTACYSTTRRVEFADTDTAGIMHFARFFTFMEEVEHEYLRSRGLSVFTADDIGPVSWPRVSARCDFQGAVRFEDVLDVELSVARLGRKSVTYGFRFTHQGRAVAAGKMTSVCCRLSPDAPPRSIPIPESIAARILGSGDACT